MEVLIVVGTENKPKLKSHKRYLFIIYCLGILFIWPTGLFWIALQGYYQYFNLYILVMVPFDLIAVLMLMSLVISPFKYSIFGPYQRRPFPNDKPLLEKSTGGRISLMSVYGPLIKFVVFPSGLGISFFGIGKVFIPTQYFTKINPHFSGNYKLEHNSSEVRSPIIFNSKDLYEALQKLQGFEKENM
jgi:hypothetical protein